MKNSKKKWINFSIIAIVSFIIDVITKMIVLKNMSLGETIPVIGKVFSWHFTYNKGALFGINPTAFIPWLPTHIFFYIFSAIALIILVNFVKQISAEKDSLSFWGAALVTGGALGNLLDRIVRPADGVIDFVMVDLGFRIGPIPFDPWPIFNGADIFINIGVALLLISSFLPSAGATNE
jgi:signal peptidase II